MSDSGRQIGDREFDRRMFGKKEAMSEPTKAQIERAADCIREVRIGLVEEAREYLTRRIARALAAAHQAGRQEFAGKIGDIIEVIRQREEEYKYGVRLSGDAVCEEILLAISELRAAQLTPTKEKGG